MIVIFRNSITHTKTGGPDAWWRLTFEKTMYIEQIKVCSVFKMSNNHVDRIKRN